MYLAAALIKILCANCPAANHKVSLKQARTPIQCTKWQNDTQQINPLCISASQVSNVLYTLLSQHEVKLCRWVVIISPEVHRADAQTQEI